MAPRLWCDAKGNGAPLPETPHAPRLQSEGVSNRKDKASAATPPWDSAQHASLPPTFSLEPPGRLRESGTMRQDKAGTMSTLGFAVGRKQLLRV